MITPTTSMHWDYFISLDADLDKFSRYVEFERSNFGTYSIEMARLLMAATQEVDVLMGQMCDKNGLKVSKESQYRRHLPQLFPKLVEVEVVLSRGKIPLKPFAAWSTGTTPLWWTANNKVKHERHSSFKMANLENMLGAVAGLMVSNLYFHQQDGKTPRLFPSPRNLSAPDMASGAAYTPWGTAVEFTLPA